MGYIDLAKQEGGKILCGGKRAQLSGHSTKGWFIEPTLIEGLSPECRTNQEEIFGPVATLTPFDSEQEVLGWANCTRYGLSANVWTRDLSRAHRFAAELHSGIVWVNCWMVRDLRTPFGGMKESGVGHEGGLDAYRFVTEPKNVCIKVAEAGGG
jgi:aminomuconate-semialdehyde/2-hydroxymuconate-6-semialdehyde dehydrogenase